MYVLPYYFRMSMIEDDLKRQRNKEAEKLKEKEKRYIITYLEFS